MAHSMVQYERVKEFRWVKKQETVVFVQLG
jgi:hypothetical protein